MMAGDAMAVVEASREADPEAGTEAWDPLVQPEWTMSAGWLALLVGMVLGTCIAAGALV